MVHIALNLQVIGKVKAEGVSNSSDKLYLQPLTKPDAGEKNEAL